MIRCQRSLLTPLSPPLYFPSLHLIASVCCAVGIGSTEHYGLQSETRQYFFFSQDADSARVRRRDKKHATTRGVIWICSVFHTDHKVFMRARIEMLFVHFARVQGSVRCCRRRDSCACFACLIPASSGASSGLSVHHAMLLAG